MKKALFVAFALAACVPATDQVGQVVAANGKTVTIRGAGDFSLANAGKGFTPTTAMVAQANEVCPGAKFASGVGTPGTDWTVDYLFICP